MVGIYARLSRDDERVGESVSIENQKEMLSRYVREQGWTLYDYYCDDGVSGTTFDRPGLNRLVQDATDRKINLVLCKDLSRLGRDYIEAGKYTDFVFPSRGCRKNTEDKHILEIDPVTAPVVRRIFDLRLQGYGFRKIALQLNAEKVPSPRSFYYMAEGRENLRGETPYWNDVTVKTILRNEVYLGHMVQNKTEIWDAVQRMDNHPARGRSGKSGTVALFGGLLRCMDCGSSMRYMRDYRKKVSDKEPEYKAYVCNRYASGGKNACASHYINQKTLIHIVLTDIRCKAMWAQNDRETLRELLLAREQSASMERTKALQAEVNAISKRLPELDKLIMSAYEDKVLGRVPESVCIQLLNQYEAERREKQDRRRELTEQLAVSRENEKSADAWLDIMRDYAQLEELDRPTLVRLIEKIVIGDRYTVDDHEERDIHIYYNFVGYIEIEE